tara:strand:- start:4976 stop:5167 length:192 start_codon:yes stop_codon:yes gene_type:complete
MTFLSSISQQDLSLLRGIVRKVHLSHVDAKGLATDEQCDRLIESIGPEVVEKMIRFGVDKGLR